VPRLASCRAAVEVLHDLGDLVEGHRNMSCSTDASRSVGDSVSSTTSSASPSRPGAPPARGRSRRRR
jgi:hypothetical protein